MRASLLARITSQSGWALGTSIRDAGARPTVTKQGSLFAADPIGGKAVNLDLLRRIGNGEKVQAKTKGATRLIAHGLAYDPHVDGRLRLTDLGEDRIAP